LVTFSSNESSSLVAIFYFGEFTLYLSLLVHIWQDWSLTPIGLFYIEFAPLFGQIEFSRDNFVFEQKSSFIFVRSKSINLA